MLKVFPEKLNAGYEAAVRRILATARQPRSAVKFEGKKPKKARANPAKRTA